MSGAADQAAQAALDFAASDERAGFRLHRLELYNWGTFDQRIWNLSPGGDNALLTGDIGSGKSTLVDAITTLLVPPQKIAYNKAAGAETRERTLRSYVLGHYKTERSDVGLSARPVSLRDGNSYSVLLAHFFNQGYDQRVTLAQVFWLKDPDGQPARLFVVCDGALSIGEHFSGFGPDIAELRKRLRKLPKTEIFDAFSGYAAAFRRRFGIENEQALDLFHQTVSMKSVGNLTDFVRHHMLEAFPIEERIEKLVQHFDDLNRAHEAVLKAKAQIARLAPIVADGSEHGKVTAEAQSLRDCRSALHAYFAKHKALLLDKRLAHLDVELARLEARLAQHREERRSQQGERDELKRSIAEHGGDRIERIKAEIVQKQVDRDARSRRADQYAHLAAAVGLRFPGDSDGFESNRRSLREDVESSTARQGRIQNAVTEASVELRGLKELHEGLVRELTSLRARRSNIPSRMLAIRAALCQALEIEEDELPFIGELVQVRPEERDWEGAINRSLRDIDYNPNRYIALDIDPSQDADIRDFQQDLRACTEGALTGSEDGAYSEAKFLQVRSLIERFRGREGSTDADRRWTRRVTDVRNWFGFSASERWREDDREHEHYTDSGGKSGGQKEKLAYTVLAASLAYQFGLERGVKRSRSFRFVAIDEAFGRGSDESARYALELFGRMNLQLLIVTPLQKIHIIEPYVAGVGFVHTDDGRQSMLRNLTIEEYRKERAARAS
jgi:uncharacterized protein YPO0396